MFVNYEKILVKINEKQHLYTNFLVFFSTFLKTKHFSPHYYLQCIMHMTNSTVIIHVTVFVVAMYVTVSSSNFIFLYLPLFIACISQLL